MVPIMNNDMDVATNHTSVSEPEQIRVSNDESISEEIRVSNDLNSSEEIRVSSGHDLGTRKGSRVIPGRGHEGQEGDDDDADDDDDARVLDEMNCRSNGDSGFDDDVEIEFREASNFDAVSDGNVRDRSVSINGVKMDGADGCGELPNSGSTDLVASRTMRIMGSGFEMGDMVWGKVKSHPWWPGHIFNEAFVSTIVRRTRKDGLVLVAFFGDSSYGWFDPLELIPYDPHYAEKSQQTTSRSFIRAVEDSMDEASRRSALGLSCRCRNPYNFRPTHLPGYMAVDVVDYEPGAIYSVSQIQRARESFQPSQALAFVKELAAAPRSGESTSLEFVKRKASVLAYRRSIFEEFDETYAQAFGQEPVRPSQSPQTQVDKEPSRAPLSGPLVVAESLGGRKSSTKVTKPKDLSNKKDRYLFKRRDEAGDLRTARISQVHATSSSSSANEDGTSDSAAAGYVLQKRDHAIPTNSDLGGAPTMDQVENSAHHITTKDAPPAGLGVTIGSDVSAKKLSLDATSGFRQLESNAAMTADVSDVHDQVPDRHMSSIISTDGGLIKKKKKIVKRPAGERSSEKPDISEKRMKKLRKTDGERSMEHPERLLSGSGENMLKSAGRPMQITAAGREDLQLSNRKKEAEVTNSVPQQAASLEAVEENEVELPQMLADLHGLALNPFHGAERSRSVIARQFFLKFRSLVFLKASSALSMAESEPGESRAIRSPPVAEPTDKPQIESSKAVPSLKPSKLLARHEDSAKLGRKRLPSERQEEIAAKKAKKITEVKSLGAEKRALVKNSEMLRPDGKTKVAVSQQPSSKPLKPEHHTKKLDGPPRVEEPTYLIMRFQAGSSLPSLVELKARFTRFGPLDIPLSRVFYKTNTCRVAFLYKQDAHVAYRYAVGSKSLFSNVKFMLKPVAATEPQHPSTGKAEDLHGDPSSNRDSSAVEPRPAVPPTALMQQQVLQQQQQLKSCLKKPSGGDEPAGPINGSGAVRTSRVRFNMGADKGVAGNKEGVVSVQMESRNAILSSEGLSCSSSSSSSVAMDVINNQRFMSSLPLQPPPLPHFLPQFPRPSIDNPQHHVELAPRINYNHNLALTTGSPGPAPPVLARPTQVQAQASAPPLPSIDISQQMMSLLTRCHDVVTNVRNILGYEPYHPL